MGDPTESVGLGPIPTLAAGGHDGTIVERDDRIVSAIADEWLATVINCDATAPAIIEQAGIADADVVAALPRVTGPQSRGVSGGP